MRSKWYYHPLFIFIFSLVALATSLFIYIRSYLKVTDAMHAFVLKHNLEAPQFLEFETWVIILILSILVGLIVVGIGLIYIYYQKMILLLRQQQSFINGFTHELKTPVASLRLFLDTFSKYELSREDFLKYVGMMKKDTERLTENIQQILNLARLEDKKSRKEFVHQNVSVYVNDFVTKNKHSFDDGDVEVTPPREDLPLVAFSPSLMDMLLTNLITNGLRYNKSDRPVVEISFGRRYRYIDIFFKDNGIGISKDEFKRIFKKFYQVNNTGRGSGIGLYMAQLVVKIHRGDIKVYSQGEGLGSTFVVSLPIVKNRYR